MLNSTQIAKKMFRNAAAIRRVYELKHGGTKAAMRLNKNARWVTRMVQFFRAAGIDPDDLSSTPPTHE